MTDIVERLRDKDFYSSMRYREKAADEIERLRALLKEARQYVSDAGDYEEPGEHQEALLADIDKALR